MRQKRTVRASSVRVRASVWWRRAICHSLWWGVGWPSLYPQSTQQTSRYKVALLDESIEGALEIAKRYNPGKECKVLFPIDPENFFVGDDLGRGGVVGKIAA